ncbi:MAG: hypothetical protein ABJN52_01940 [Litorimonas sp.]
MRIDKGKRIQTLPDSWVELSVEERLTFTDELKKELCRSHRLFGRKLMAVARRERADDFLFVDEENNDHCFVVHLTWRRETKADWPWTTSFNDYSDFASNWRKHFD